MKHTLYIGLNDKDTKTQLISTAEALHLVNTYCALVFDGATVSTASGVYTHENGEITVETTIKVELFTDNENAVKTAASAFKDALNQETIGYTVEPVKLVFI